MTHSLHDQASLEWEATLGDDLIEFDPIAELAALNKPDNGAGFDPDPVDQPEEAEDTD